MAILFSGDFHNNEKDELYYITPERIIKFFSKKAFDEIKYHIILGDGGFSRQSQKNTVSFEHLAERPFPVLVVMGNDEPALDRSNLPEVDIGIGEKVILVNKENPFVAYLKRGTVYTIEDHKFLVLGGALSIDKESRKPNESLRENEYWSVEEEARLFRLLQDDNNFDYVLSHTGPDNINRKVFGWDPAISPHKFQDEVAFLNNKIDESIMCKRWFCGHFHQDQSFNDKRRKRKYQYLYRSIALLNGNKLEVKPCRSQRPLFFEYGD